MLAKVCSTLVQPRYVLVESSSTENKSWTLVSPTIFNDTICECPGYIFRGECKHVKRVAENSCSWAVPAEHGEEIDRCPDCGAPAIEFELEAQDG